jgi:hypothetical protein
VLRALGVRVLPAPHAAARRLRARAGTKAVVFADKLTQAQGVIGRVANSEILNVS